MKKVREVLLLVAVGLVMACSMPGGGTEQASGPGDALRKYIEACDAGDLPAASAHVIRAASEGLAARMLEGSCTAGAQHRKALGGVVRIDVENETITGEVAVARVQIVLHGGETMGDQRNMQYEAGGWRIVPDWLSLRQRATANSGGASSIPRPLVSWPQAGNPADGETSNLAKREQR